MIFFYETRLLLVLKWKIIFCYWVWKGWYNKSELKRKNFGN